MYLNEKTRSFQENSPVMNFIKHRFLEGEERLKVKRNRVFFFILKNTSVNITEWIVFIKHQTTIYSKLHRDLTQLMRSGIFGCWELCQDVERSERSTSILSPWVGSNENILD